MELSSDYAWEVWFYEGDEYVGAHTEQFDTRPEAIAWLKANPQAGVTVMIVWEPRVRQIIGRGDR
jgi:hypothetical protein